MENKLRDEASLYAHVTTTMQKDAATKVGGVLSKAARG
jgi:hypothetical protein